MKASSRRMAGGALVLAAALTSLPGCATKGDLRNVTNELRVLSAQQDSVRMALQQQARITQDSLRGTADQLFDIRGTFNQQLNRIQDELAIVREENAQLHRTLAAIRDQLEEMSRAQRFGAGPGAIPGAPGGPAPLATGGSAAVEHYNTAVSQFNMGNLTAARTAFNDFLRQYPGDDLAPEAEYKLADILVQEGRMQDAIERFARIPQLYPTALKAPDALFRIGLIHRDQGRRSEARRYLERVVETYPNSVMAELAADALREMGPGP